MLLYSNIIWQQMFPKELIPPTITHKIFQMQRECRFMVLGPSAPAGRRAGVATANPSRAHQPSQTQHLLPWQRRTFSGTSWSCSSRAGDCVEDVGDGRRRCRTERELGLKGKLGSKRRGGQKDANWKKKSVQSWL